jgi:hypothetical protein
VSPSSVVEVRGWVDSRDDTWAESCLFHAVQRVLGCNEAEARRLAHEFRDQGSIHIDVQSRDTAERLSEDLQGVGALVYLTPREGPITFSEVHAARWGSRMDETATCQRVTGSNFHVALWVPTVDGVTGEPTPRPMASEHFSLSSVPASCVKIIGEDEDTVLLDAELNQPLRSVARRHSARDSHATRLWTHHQQLDLRRSGLLVFLLFLLRSELLPRLQE